MPLNNLADMITAIQNGTQAEKIQFATMVVNAQAFLDAKNQADAEAIKQAGIDVATTWWNSTIQPTLLWNNTQPLTEQRDNILIDYNNVKLLLNTETDQYRIYVIKQKLQQAEDKFKQIKQQLSGA